VERLPPRRKVQPERKAGPTKDQNVKSRDIYSMVTLCYENNVLKIKINQIFLNE
jgi:hypothetical protein